MMRMKGGEHMLPVIHDEKLHWYGGCCVLLIYCMDLYQSERELLEFT